MAENSFNAQLIAADAAKTSRTTLDYYKFASKSRDLLPGTP